MKKESPKQQIKVIITTEATFDLDGLRDIESWRDSIIEYGEIINERIEIVETK